MEDLLDDGGLFDEDDFDEPDLYQFNDIGLALRLEAVRALADA